MRALKRTLDRSPTAQAALVLVLTTGVTALLRPAEHPAWWAVKGVLYTAIAMAFVVAQRRKAARAAGTEPHEIADLSRAVRRREVPRDPGERATMRRFVAAQLGRMERGARWLPYWLGFMGLIAVGTLALGVAAGTPTVPLIVAIGVLAFCCWVLWMRRVSLDRFRHMSAALEAPRTAVPADRREAPRAA
ncbi:hypothetical protein [Streptomyces flavofungini]|uniref:hypothetical protein n=1 Tax=Streptomyces flavofungini TaxID=68200 RepID=UPI0034DFA7A8